jgi:hypothetical protein
MNNQNKKYWLNMDTWSGDNLAHFLAYGSPNEEMMTVNNSVGDDFEFAITFIFRAVSVGKLSAFNYENKLERENILGLLFTPKNAIKWAVNHLDMFGNFPFSSTDIEQSAESLGTKKAPDVWPWGSHSTRNLELLAQAVERFWIRYDPEDPTTAPKNSQVSAWLQERGMSERVAEITAQIIRAGDLKAGRR